MDHNCEHSSSITLFPIAQIWSNIELPAKIIRCSKMVAWFHLQSVAFLIPCLHYSLAKSTTMMSDVRLRGTQTHDARELDSTEYSDTEIQYFSECEDILLGEDIIEDGLISQKEFATTYTALCNKYSVESASCPEIGFANLPSALQSLFFEAVCMVMSEPSRCVQNLNSMNSMQVGYIVSAETTAEVQMNVGNLCLELVDHAFGK